MAPTDHPPGQGKHTILRLMCQYHTDSWIWDDKKTLLLARNTLPPPTPQQAKSQNPTSKAMEDKTGENPVVEMDGGAVRGPVIVATIV